MTVNMTDLNTFFFLYDGSTDWSDQGLLMGQKDIPLNEKGRQEAEEAGKLLVGHEIASLCFSPLSRSKETAQIIAKHCHCGLYPMDGFKERLWGSFEGQKSTMKHLLATDEVLSVGVEEIDNFAERVRLALVSIRQYPSPTLIVSHANVLAIICKDLDVEYPLNNNEKGVIHFFQRLGRWVAKPLESNGNQF